jgi:lipopolysaccharide transport system permease protein
MLATPARQEQPLLDLDGPTTAVSAVLRQVWASRDLVSTLARREFFARYRRATLGVVWAVALPLLQAVVLAVIFTRVAHLPLPGNAFVFVFTGMASWAFFSTGLSAASTSIVDNNQLASKIYFPRLALPLVAVASNSFVAVVNLVIVLIGAYATGASLSPKVLLLVPALALLLLLTATLASVLAALHVYFRDIRYLVQAGLLLFFYLTPVFYPLSRAPAALATIVKVNPISGVIELYRAATVGADAHYGVAVAITGAWIVVLAGASMWLYSRFDRVFADLL